MVALCLPRTQLKEDQRLWLCLGSPWVLGGMLISGKFFYYITYTRNFWAALQGSARLTSSWWRTWSTPPTLALPLRGPVGRTSEKGTTTPTSQVVMRGVTGTMAKFERRRGGAGSGAGGQQDPHKGGEVAREAVGDPRRVLSRQVSQRLFTCL